jgi:hypothetical protein
MRLSILIAVILVTNVLTGTMTYLIMSRSAAVAAAAEAARREAEAASAEATRRSEAATRIEAGKQAEAVARQQAHDEIVKAITALRAVELQFPAKSRLPDQLRILRHNAASADELDLTRCPKDVQAAFHIAAQALRDHANFLEVTARKRGDANMMALLSLTAAAMSGGITIPLAGKSVVDSTERANQAKEEGEEDMQRLKTAISQLHHVVANYGVNM